jgi:hypothetical protein
MPNPTKSSTLHRKSSGPICSNKGIHAAGAGTHRDGDEGAPTQASLTLPLLSFSTWGGGWSHKEEEAERDVM